MVLLVGCRQNRPPLATQMGDYHRTLELAAAGHCAWIIHSLQDQCHRPSAVCAGGGNPDANTRQTVGEIAFFAAPVRHRALCQPPPSFGSRRNAQHPRLSDGVFGRGAVAMDGPLARTRPGALHRRHHRMGPGAGGSPFPFRCAGGTYGRGIGGKCGGRCLLVGLTSMSILGDSQACRGCLSKHGDHMLFVESALSPRATHE